MENSIFASTFLSKIQCKYISQADFLTIFCTVVKYAGGNEDTRNDVSLIPNLTILQAKLFTGFNSFKVFVSEISCDS